MSLRLSLLWLVCFFPIPALAEEQAASRGDKAPGSFLEQAALETWIRDSTGFASPRLGVVTQVDKDRGVFVVTEKIATAVKEQRTVIIFGGKTQLQPVVKFVVATIRERYSLENDPLYDVDGNRVKPARAMERLRVGRAVVLSSDGQMVDARYCQALNKDTLILIPPVVQPLREHELEDR